MPPRERKPLWFRFKTFTPRNRTQEVRIRIPQSPHRPIKILPHDALKREFIDAQRDERFVEHRRGPYRPKIGLDYQESRAVPKYLVRGTLPERIVYKKLTDRHLFEPADFTFQSSQDGGRFELGGMVVDFLFEDWRLALRVQGYTHDRFLQMAKDEEQAAILESFGFTVKDIATDTILDEMKCEEWFRRNIDALATTRVRPETFTEEL